MIGKTEAEIDADWLARRAALRADKAPTLPTVLGEIEHCVGLLMRMAAEAQAGRMELVEVSTDSRPGEASVLLPLLKARHGQ